MSIRPWKKGALSERGETLIEFALVLPLLLVITLGAVDFGRAFFVKNVLAQAAREGVRYIAVNSYSDPDQATARTRVKNLASAAGVVLIDSNIEIMPAPSDASLSEVKVTASFNWLFPGLYRMIGATVTNPTPLVSTCYMRKEG